MCHWFPCVIINLSIYSFTYFNELIRVVVDEPAAAAAAAAAVAAAAAAAAAAAVAALGDPGEACTAKPSLSSNKNCVLLFHMSMYACTYTA